MGEGLKKCLELNATLRGADARRAGKTAILGPLDVDLEPGCKETEAERRERVAQEARDAGVPDAIMRFFQEAEEIGAVKILSVKRTPDDGT